MQRFACLLLFLWLPMQAHSLWQPEVYEKHNWIQRSDVDLLIQLVPVKTYKHILELGTRDEVALLSLHKACPNANLYALSLDQDFDTSIKQKAFKLPPVQFLGSDIRSLHQNSGYDLIFSLHYLHWIPKAHQVAILNRLYQSLQPGGILVAALSPVKNPERPFAQIAKKLLAKPEYQLLKGFKDSRSLYTPFDYKVMLESAGFKITSIGYLNRVRKFHNTEKLKQSIQQWYSQGNEAIIKRYPDLVDAYLTELSSRLATTLRKNSDQDTMEWDVDLMVVMASK